MAILVKKLRKEVGNDIIKTAAINNPVFLGF